MMILFFLLLVNCLQRILFRIKKASFELDSFDDDEYCARTKTDSLINNHSSVDRVHSASTMKSNDKKMSDITHLLDSIELNDKQDNFDSISTDVADYLRTHSLPNNQTNYEKQKWETEEKYLKYGKNQNFY